METMQPQKKPILTKPTTKSKTQTGKPDFKSFVEEQVLNKLGKPDNLNFIRASNVFNNRWRVDVWCYHKVEGCISEQSCSMIDHSYFIHVDEHGKIIKSDPKINREY